MPTPLASLVFCALVCVSPLAPAALAQDVGPTLERGDALADEGKYDEAVMAYMRAYEALLPRMRGLAFKHEVEGRLMPRKELQQFIIKMADEELKPEDIRSDELVLKAIGLVPADFDLKQTMIALLTEEIAGFYDSRKKLMYLIHEALPPGPRKEPGLFARMMGAKPAFDKQETRAVLAHEMAHALADQNYNLEAMSKAAEGDSDRELALGALVEGEAMLAMIAAMDEDWDGERTAQMPAEVFERMLSMLGPMTAASGGKAFRDAPPIMTETLVFPYLRGLVFCAHVANDGGWKGLDAAYKNPPISTEQVMHPEKYLGNGVEKGAADYDAPQRITIGELKPGEGWRRVGEEIMGELGISILLRQQRARPAAAGWDGDSCMVFESPAGGLGMVWLTTWDSPEDAREFAAEYAKYQGRRFALLGVPQPEAANEPPVATAEADHFADVTNQALIRITAGKTLRIELRDTEVAIVEGFDEPATEALSKAALAATRQEVQPAGR